MSLMRKPNARPVSINVADLHFSDTPPPARAGEVSWFLAMTRVCQLLASIQDSYGNIPIVCAGDIFHHWKSSPALINLVLEHLPHMFAIPGQHDLPMHNYADIKRSAYWTLVRANRIWDLKPGIPYVAGDDLILYGFPWGIPITPRPTKGPGFHQAVVHAYIWSGVHKYQGAPVDREKSYYKEQLKTYDAATFGDNHKGFITLAGRCKVINCGSFMRRISDEGEWQPRAVILYDDCTTDTVPLWFEDEKFERTAPEASRSEVRVALTDFLAELTTLGEHGLDFPEAVRRYLETHEVKPAVKLLLLETLECLKS